MRPLSSVASTSGNLCAHTSTTTRPRRVSGRGPTTGFGCDGTWWRHPRYGACVRLPRTDLDTPLSQAFARRATCRDLTTDPLTDDELAAVLAGARREETGWAYPSAHDLRPVRLLVLGEPESADRSGRPVLAFDPAGNSLTATGHVVRRPVSFAVHEEQPWLDVAPVVVALTADLDPVAAEFAAQEATGLRGRDFVMIEAGALAQNLLLGAASAGLGAVLVAGVRQDECRELLDTPDHVVALVALGHPQTSR